MPGKTHTVDDYLSALPDDKRDALERLRAMITSVAPSAEECISYGIPAFKLDGMLVGYGATARHCAFYLMSANTVAEFADVLETYDTSKGTIRFSADRPLPVSLVRKLVKARIRENAG